MSAPPAIAAVAPAVAAPDGAEVVLDYHASTKHTLSRYAAGPETLDWDAQPNPFREFAGSPRLPLALAAHTLGTDFAQTIRPVGIAAAPLSLASLGGLLELSLGLAAWKELGPDRWALRCNPSSGNLHPTEAYVMARGVAGIADGLYHYVSRDHVLEQRCTGGGGPCGLWIGLSSIHWREAWKYGERAFRYCQLDIGHALGALRYAAGALGWTAQVAEGLDGARLAALMGLDRLPDFAGAEAEEADVLLAIAAGPDAPARPPPLPWTDDAAWAGRANLLDPHPMYRWPVIEQASRASRATRASVPAAGPPGVAVPALPAPDARAAEILLGRRSAQRFDSRHRMAAGSFYRLLDALLVRSSAPWDLWNWAPQLHPVLFVHRVDGLEPGLYALPRHPAAKAALRAQLRADFRWQPVEGAPSHLPLVRLVAADCRAMARTVSCHQAIASDGCFALSLLAEFETVVRADPWRYRQLHWEAGLLGHVLYLEAEAAGLRGTGIGCFFDDALHELLGLQGQAFQALYNFTVGRPLTDARILTLPAYPGRTIPAPEEPTP